MSDDHDAADRQLLITSEPREDGTYIAVLSVDADRSWSVSPFGARRHALAALHAAAVADFEQAVYHQLTDGLGVDQTGALKVVAALRHERGAVDDATAALRFVPGLNMRGEGFIHITLDGEPIGQLDAHGARDHAIGVLELVAVLRLDAVYRRLLVTHAGLNDEQAVAAVADLIDHRPAR